MNQWDDMTIVLHKEFSEHLKRGHVLIGLLSMVVMWAFNIGIVGKTIVASMGRPGLALLVDNLITHQSLSFFVIATFMLMTALFKKEKASGSIESLMATPLSLTGVWLGKTVTMWLAAMVFSFATILIVYFELHILFIADQGYIFPGIPSIVFLFAVYPIFSLILSAFLGLAQLTFARSWIGGSLYLFMGMGYLMLTSARMNELIMNWYAIMAYILVMFLLLAAIGLLKPRLNCEKIVLSEVA